MVFTDKSTVVALLVVKFKLMHQSQWHKFKELIETNYPRAEWAIDQVEIDTDAHGLPVKAKVEYVEFEGDSGLIRLEYWEKPLLLEKRTVSARRIGSEVGEIRVYSTDEVSGSLKAFLWNKEINDWKEVKAEDFLNANNLR